MKKYFEVKEFTAPTGKEFDAESYPGVGIYVDRDGQYRIIYRVVGSTIKCCLYLGILDEMTKEAIVEIEDEADDHTEPYGRTTATLTAAPVSAVTANDLLKAIAISQNPALAVELCK